jgi:predicted transcriptional regulator
MFAEYMLQHGASTIAEMAEFSGHSPQRTRAILSKMVDDGIIITEESNKTYFEIFLKDRKWLLRLRNSRLSLRHIPGMS